MAHIEGLVVLGAGHVGSALSRLSGAVGLPHVVVDDRPAFARAERLPAARAVLCGRFPAALQQLEPDRATAVLIVTRCHRTDLVCVEHALDTDAGYVGLIASRHKVQWMNEKFAHRGIAPAADPRFHAPMGLDLGDDTPAGIALAVLAEIVTQPGPVRHARELLKV